MVLRCKNCNGDNVQLLKCDVLQLRDRRELRERFYCADCECEFDIIR